MNLRFLAACTALAAAFPAVAQQNQVLVDFTGASIPSLNANPPDVVRTSTAMIFPATDVELVDTWDTMGLCGTGSVDMKVHQVRVPAARSVSLLVDKPVSDGPLYVFPVFGQLAIGEGGGGVWRRKDERFAFENGCCAALR